MIIGGTIASLSPILIAFLQQRRWKAEQRVAHLKAKRADLKELFNDAINQIGTGPEVSMPSTEVGGALVHQYPVEVASEIIQMLDNCRGNGATRELFSHHHFQVQVAMSKELSRIDRQIEEAIS